MAENHRQSGHAKCLCLKETAENAHPRAGAAPAPRFRLSPRPPGPAFSRAAAPSIVSQAEGAQATTEMLKISFPVDIARWLQARAEDEIRTRF